MGHSSFALRAPGSQALSLDPNDAHINMLPPILLLGLWSMHSYLWCLKPTKSKSEDVSASKLNEPINSSIVSAPLFLTNICIAIFYHYTEPTTNIYCMFHYRHQWNIFCCVTLCLGNSMSYSVFHKLWLWWWSRANSDLFLQQSVYFFAEVKMLFFGFDIFSVLWRNRINAFYICAIQ